MPDQEQNNEASRHVIIYMDLIFQMVKLVTPLYDMRQSKVQRNVHFVVCTTGTLILAIKCWFLQIAVTNHWNSFYRVLILKRFIKHFYIFLGMATFSPTFQKDKLPITP
jgi:hypothetical protein